jgi:hypothetical protein
MNPVVLIGGAAALILLSGGKKKSSSKSGGGNGGGGVSGIGRVAMKIPGGPGSGDTGAPWSWCEPPAGSSKKTFAAYGMDKKCMVFWDDNTWQVARQYIDIEYAKLSKEDQQRVCAAGECVPDPYAADPTLFCEWEDSPEAVELVKKVVFAMYPTLQDGVNMGRISFPPVAGTTPYFPSMAWKFVYGEMQKHICGFVPVT